jgi:hypothetical protein
MGEVGNAGSVSVCRKGGRDSGIYSVVGKSIFGLEAAGAVSVVRKLTERRWSGGILKIWDNDKFGAVRLQTTAYPKHGKDSS